MFELGTRVRTTQVIDKYPQSDIPAGELGTVVWNDGDHIHVKMDTHFPTYDTWDNVVYFDADADVKEEEFIAGDYLEVVP